MEDDMQKDMPGDKMRQGNRMEIGAGCENGYGEGGYSENGYGENGYGEGCKTAGEDAELSCCHHKLTPRSDKELRNLKNRLSRMSGQLSGIGRMLDDNRYCGDILTQVAAVESALQSFGYMILREHMETCVVEEIRKGNVGVVEEAVELIKKLK